MPDDSRIDRQLRFLREIDRLKTVFRQTWLLDQSRRENDAEHSWHLATMAVLLAEHAAEPDVDLPRTIRMLLLHDLVEIDAGDTFAYDPAAQQDKAARELAAAERIFGLLPSDQGAEFRELWDEFESRHTPEARFAAALDCFQPLMHNYLTGGRAWREHGVSESAVRRRTHAIAEGAPALWALAERMIEEAVERGDLLRGH